MKHLIIPTLCLLATSLALTLAPLRAQSSPAPATTNKAAATPVAPAKPDSSPGISLTIDTKPAPAATKASGATPHASGMGEVVEDIFDDCGVPLGFFVMIGFIVWLNISSCERRRQVTHETIRLMIEKGLPVPPELFSDRKNADPRSPRSHRDLRRGIVLIAAGIGVVAFFGVVHNHIWAVGLVPLLMGIGYIIVWKIDRNQTIGVNPPQP